MHPTSRTPFPLRMWRASLLHADTYEDGEADRGSIGQAFAVVLMASSAGALGTWVRVVTGHPLCVAPGHPGTVARSNRRRYSAHGLRWTFTEKSGLFSPLDYSGP